MSLKRVFSKKNVESTTRFFSAYAKTWVGMSPLWLMGEAIMPGQKVGGQFKKGSKELIAAAEDLRLAVVTSTQDIVVIIDQQLKTSKEETGKTAEVIKAAGENAIVVVSTSLEQARDQIKTNSPKIKKIVVSNSKDVVVVVDKALKNPLVITGITKFAKAQGIPHPEALLQVASLALSRLTVILAEAALDAEEQAAQAHQPYGIPSGSTAESSASGKGGVQEVDASDFERASSKEAGAEAVKIGKAGEGTAPRVEQGSSKGRSTGDGPKATTNKDKEDKTGCIIT